MTAVLNMTTDQEQIDSLKREIRQGFTAVQEAIADLAANDARIERDLRRMDVRINQRLDEHKELLDMHTELLNDYRRQLYNINVQIVELLYRMRVVERRTAHNGPGGKDGPGSLDDVDDRDAPDGQE